MKFIIEVDIEPLDERGPITQEQILEHMRTYEFTDNVSYELSLIEDDPNHEEGQFEDYRLFRFVNAKIEVA